MGTRTTLVTVKLTEETRLKIKAKTELNGKKMYFYIAELIDAGIELEEQQDKKKRGKG